MSRHLDVATPSQLERGATASPSPALDALQSHLESGLTLNRKRSWFGSARDVLSKVWRSDASSRLDENEDRCTAVQNEEAEIGLLDDDSTTPLRPRPERHHTFTPRHAISSLRQHIASSNHRHKRKPLTDITHNETCMPIGPEQMTTSPTSPREREGDVKIHSRKNSLGKSLVGSIRTLGKKSMKSTACSPTKTIKEDQLSPTTQAAAIPLPSSPINVPPPPTLHVDLGPSALLPNSPPSDPKDELMRITNPENMSGERLVPTYYTRLPGEGPSDHQGLVAKRESLTPSDLLQLPTDDQDFNITEDPKTPTSSARRFSQVDGTNDEIELFERSVEYKDKSKKKENRTLKKMVSLDAMAEECATSPMSDSATKLLPGDPQRTRNKPSMTTIESCPDDMPAITRQLAQLQTPSAGHRDPTSGKWVSEDPFAPGNAVGDIASSGPPSPTRSVKLPVRPKIMVQSTEAIEPKTYDDSDLATPEALKYDGIEREEDIRKASPFNDYGNPIHTTRTFCRNPGDTALTATSDNGFAKGTSTRSPEAGEYGEFKTKALFGDLHEPAPPEYHSADSPDKADVEAALQRRQSVAQLYQRITNSQTPSPPRCRAGTTHTPNVSDVFWKLEVKSKAPQESSSVERTEMPVTESLATADISPMTSASNRTPNMGDAVEFEIKRSERNMRYNALRDSDDTPEYEDEAVLPSSMRPAPLRPSLKIDTTAKLKTKTSSDLSLLNFDGWTCSSSRKSSPLKPSARQSRVGVSSDSIDHDLHNAISQHYVFQAAVAGLGITEPYSSSTANVTPSEGLPMFGKDRSQNTAVDLPGISPDSYNLWESMEDGAFDTPPRQSKEEGVLHEYRFKTPLPGSAPADDSLDDCLEMYQNYSKSQEMLSSDNVQPSEGIENPFSSSHSRGSSASPASPNKKPLPSRYRNSKRGRN